LSSRIMVVCLLCLALVILTKKVNRSKPHKKLKLNQSKKRNNQRRNKSPSSQVVYQLCLVYQVCKVPINKLVSQSQPKLKSKKRNNNNLKIRHLLVVFHLCKMLVKIIRQRRMIKIMYNKRNSRLNPPLQIVYLLC